MNPIDYLILAVIAGIIALACFAIYRSKKAGNKCIGCPDSKTCSGSCGGCSGRCAGRKE